MWYIHTVKYCSTIKRKKKDAFYNIDDPWKYANKRIKPQRSTYHMISLTYIFHNRQIYRDRNIVSCLGLGGRYKEWRMSAGRPHFYLRDGEDLLKFIVVMDAQLCKYSKTTNLHTLVW